MNGSLIVFLGILLVGVAWFSSLRGRARAWIAKLGNGIGIRCGIRMRYRGGVRELGSSFQNVAVAFLAFGSAGLRDTFPGYRYSHGGSGAVWLKRNWDYLLALLPRWKWLRIFISTVEAGRGRLRRSAPGIAK